MGKRTKKPKRGHGDAGRRTDFEPPDLEALGVTMDEFVEACRWFVEHFAALEGLSQNQVDRLKRRERRRSMERWLRKQRSREGLPRG